MHDGPAQIVDLRRYRTGQRATKKPDLAARLFLLSIQKILVNHFLIGGLPKFRNFVLQYQFASLKFMQFELVNRGMELFLFDLPFKRHMPAFEFGEMALQGHAQLLSMLERQDCDTMPATRKRENFFAPRLVAIEDRSRKLTGARFRDCETGFGAMLTTSASPSWPCPRGASRT
ncbi:hypothetical protein [Rhodoblastus sp.]|uniref:hypothetical protein n=1 Tax=Rhodoblastus sp. TaxID=1962975 RepID=UPI003F945E0F